MTCDAVAGEAELGGHGAGESMSTVDLEVSGRLTLPAEHAPPVQTTQSALRPDAWLVVLHLVTAAACFALIVVVHQAVPFVTLPQFTALPGWVGFAEEWASEGLLHPHSTHFGYPSEIPLAFGLTAVWPMAVLIRLGMSGTDAYAVVNVAFLLLAFVGAHRFVRALGGGRWLGIGMATIWLILPIVWVTSAVYMMTGWGFALLPGLLWATLSVVRSAGQPSGALPRGLGLAAVVALSVFLDGYSFVMFALGAGLLFTGVLVVGYPRRRDVLLRAVAPFGLAAILSLAAYSRYVAVLPTIASGSLDSFRAYGADLLFLVSPSAGVIWLWDGLGLSTARSGTEYWGDASVWRSTFSAILLLGAVLAAITLVRRRKIAIWLAAVALAGLYLALGPSLKVGVGIPAGHGPSGQLPAELAGPPTGSGWLFMDVPGFESMRATYRWIALGLLGAWGLISLGVASVSRRSRVLAMAVVLALAVTHLPDLGTQLRTGKVQQSRADLVEATLLPDLAAGLHPGERVIFTPAANDFLVNHVAPRLSIFAYNIGGDRHNVAVRKAWPPEIGAVSSVGSSLVADQALLRNERRRIRAALVGGNVDVVVLPYFDLVSFVACGDPSVADSPCHARYVRAQATLDALGEGSGRISMRIDRFAHYATVRVLLPQASDTIIINPSPRAATLSSWSEEHHRVPQYEGASVAHTLGPRPASTNWSNTEGRVPGPSTLCGRTITNERHHESWS